MPSSACKKNTSRGTPAESSAVSRWVSRSASSWSSPAYAISRSSATPASSRSARMRVSGTALSLSIWHTGLALPDKCRQPIYREAPNFPDGARQRGVKDLSKQLYIVRAASQDVEAILDLVLAQSCFRPHYPAPVQAKRDYFGSKVYFVP